MAIQGLPVRFPIDRAGFVGADGPTHAGSFDITYLATLPGFVVMAAADEAELKHMVRTAADYDEGPISFRYPRGEGVGVEMPERGSIIEIGKGRIVKEGSKVPCCRSEHGWPIVFWQRKTLMPPVCRRLSRMPASPNRWTPT